MKNFLQDFKDGVNEGYKSTISARHVMALGVVVWLSIITILVSIL